MVANEMKQQISEHHIDDMGLVCLRVERLSDGKALFFKMSAALYNDLDDDGLQQFVQKELKETSPLEIEPRFPLI